MDEVIRVLVVDDREMVTEGLSLHPRRPSDLFVVGPADDADEALRLCDRFSVDVMLVDIDRPNDAGIEAVRRIHLGCPGVRIVAMSAFGATDAIASAIVAGACGYVPKSSGVDDLIRTVRRAAAGEMVMPADDLSSVLDELRETRMRTSIEDHALQRLTGREREILRELAAGQGTVEIAEGLGISPLTVQSHVKNILAKLGVHSKVEAVTLAWREGLAPIPQSA